MEMRVSERVERVALAPVAEALGCEAEQEAMLAEIRRREACLFRAMTGEDPPSGSPITDAWWGLVDRLKEAESKVEKLQSAVGRREAERDAAERARMLARIEDLEDRVERLEES